MARRGHYEELRCVLAVIRHGDRTPKQKMKMKVTQAGLPRQQPAEPPSFPTGAEPLGVISSMGILSANCALAEPSTLN